MSGYSNLSLMTEPVTQLISVGGSELTDSRRYVDLWDCEAANCQFKSSAGMSVRVEYSLDDGGSWNTLVDESGYFGGNPYTKGWVVIPEESKQNDVLLRAIGVGIGLLTTVNFVEIGFR